VLHFQYNDNNGNVYSDVYWLSAMVQAIGELELGQQVCTDAYHLEKCGLYLLLDAFHKSIHARLVGCMVRTK
jgi:hypothetical protein